MNSYTPRTPTRYKALYKSPSNTQLIKRKIRFSVDFTLILQDNHPFEDSLKLL